MVGTFAMKSGTLLCLLFGAGLWSGASEAATMRVLACNNCSPLQEEQKALAGQHRGFLFVANVTNKRIRKFEIAVWVDGLSSGTTDGGSGKIDDAKARLKANATKIGETTDRAEGTTQAPDANATRELWEHAVDDNVRRIFDTIVSVEARVPGVVSGQRAIEAPIRGIGLTAGSIGPRPHDPREIAWYSGSPRGAAYNDFMDRLRGQIADRSATERISPELADLVHGIQGQMRGASISVGTDSAAFDISWERVAPTVELKLCDDDGNCVTIIVKKEGNYVQTTYEGATDRYNVSLPTEQQTPMRLTWRQGDGVNAYANWLRSQRHGTIDYVGGSQAGCGFGYVLACVRIEGSTMLACQVHCR